MRSPLPLVKPNSKLLNIKVPQPRELNWASIAPPPELVAATGILSENQAKRCAHMLNIFGAAGYSCVEIQFQLYSWPTRFQLHHVVKSTMQFFFQNSRETCFIFIQNLFIQIKSVRSRQEIKMTKFRQCRRPHQSRSPQSQHHRTQCRRRGRLEGTFVKKRR